MKLLLAFAMGLTVSAWVSISRDEAERYNAKHRAQLTWWDAVWLNLDEL